MCLHRYLLGRKLGVIKVIWEKHLSVFSKVIVEGLLCSRRGKEIRFGEQLTGFISVAGPPIGPSDRLVLLSLGQKNQGISLMAS